MTHHHITSWLTDMDGVLVKENTALPGAADLLEQWRRDDSPYLVLTNNSIFTARDLSARLRASGLHVPEDRIWTSALATADFLSRQSPGGSAFVVGEAGITTALHAAGFIMTETDPDYVVVGETRNYSFEAITKAIRLILDGARFIATNPDATGPSEDGVLPATGAISALITKATGHSPYVVGKPNPMMFRSALNRIGAHSETTAMIGDRMDTDIVAGMEAGLHTILVMSGIADEAEVQRQPFRPEEIISGVHELVRQPEHDDAADLLIQDSWLVEDGQVRALEAHLRRFSSAVTALPGTEAPDAEAVAELLATVPSRLPREGRRFPRLFARWDDPARPPELGLQLRPAPVPDAGEPVLAPLSPGDPRRHPRLKGPDLAMLGRLREASGADEAVLLDDAGHVLEGAWSSLVWWSAPDRLGVPRGTVLDSVTRGLLERIVREHGIAVVAEDRHPQELAGREVWCLSALHGIRRVGGWRGADASSPPAAPALPLLEARAALAATAAALDA